MALLHTITTESGVTFEAYIRVVRVDVQKGSAIALAHILAHKDHKIPAEIVQYVFDHDLNGENAIKQAYIYMKTLPEYGGAMDV